VSWRQHHGVALDAEAAIEHDEIPFAVVGLRVAIRLDDAQPGFATGWNGAGKRHLDVHRLRVGAGLPGRRASLPVTTFHGSGCPVI